MPCNAPAMLDLPRQEVVDCLQKTIFPSDRKDKQYV